MLAPPPRSGQTARAMGSSISLEVALQRVLAVPCERLPTEHVDLAAARGRIAATDNATRGPWPSTDRSAMDGFAVAAGSGLARGVRLPVVGESRAGHPFALPLPPGRAIRIMTGAVVPPGADAVVPVEQTSGFDGDTVELAAPVARGQHIRPIGSEAAAGQVVVPAGSVLRAAEIGALAVLGCARVAVVTRPRVAILATGDEVVPVATTPAPHQVRESNSWALAAQVEECGAASERFSVAPDEPAQLTALLERGLATADVLVTIGGVSKGSHDLVHETLQRLGVAVEFHGIELKPGKPTLFGVRRAARTTHVFGLPGNPASCFTVFDLLVRPLLLRLLGTAVRPWTTVARLAGSWKANARLQAVPVALRTEGSALVAELQPPSPSGDPFSVVGGSAYALLPAGSKPGELATATVVGYSAGVQLA